MSHPTDRAFSLPESWRAVRLIMARPQGWVHAAAVGEVMESLFIALKLLGIDVDFAENQARDGAINIYFMPFYLTEDQAKRLAPNSILYNFEQIGGEFDILTPGFRTAIRTCRVWDYSRRNLDRLAPFIGHDRVQVVPVGYVPALTRIPRASVQDIDVLFYGAVNERRKALLDAMTAAGIGLQHVFGVYGAQRDALIARAKLVLNIHAHPTKIMEVVRISYLLANRKAVVTELDDMTAFDADLRDAVAGVPYERIIEECRRLLADDEARQALEDRGYRCFQQRDLIPILRDVITAAA
jgi:hypothetical protein